MKKLLEQKQKRSVKYGDVFQVGNHVVACGDSRDAELVRRVIDKNKIKLVLCDVPYGVSYTENKAGFSKVNIDKAVLNDNISSESEYAKFTEAWIAPLLPHLEPKNSFYVFSGDTMLFPLREGMKRAGVKFAQLLIWIKSQAAMGRRDYLPAHELILFGWHGTHEFMKSKDKSLLFHPKPAKNMLHPTQKPVGLIRRLVLNSTAIGDLVYDGFAGSGTTGVAAEQTKRKSILIELDAEYCATILKRLEDVTRAKVEKVKP